jgi:hypothetical protein
MRTRQSGAPGFLSGLRAATAGAGPSRGGAHAARGRSCDGARGRGTAACRARASRRGSGLQLRGAERARTRRIGGGRRLDARVSALSDPEPAHRAILRIVRSRAGRAGRRAAPGPRSARRGSAAGSRGARAPGRIPAAPGGCRRHRAGPPAGAAPCGHLREVPGGVRVGHALLQVLWRAAAQGREPSPGPRPSRGRGRSPRRRPGRRGLGAPGHPGGHRGSRSPGLGPASPRAAPPLGAARARPHGPFHPGGSRRRAKGGPGPGPTRARRARPHRPLRPVPVGLLLRDRQAHRHRGRRPRGTELPARRRPGGHRQDRGHGGLAGATWVRPTASSCGSTSPTSCSMGTCSCWV